MKKRAISLILAFAMVATTFFGAAPSAQASDNVSTPAVIRPSEDLEPVTELPDIAKTTEVPESAPVNVKRILTSATTKASMSSYDIGYNQYVLAPITPEYSGWLWFDYKTNGDGYGDIIFLRSFDYVDGTFQNVDGAYVAGIYGNDSDNDIGGVYVKAGTTYWLYMDVTEGTSSTVNIRGNIYTTSERTLSEGTSKWTIASGVNRSENVSTTYFKIKPSKTGYIKVDLKAFGDGKSYGSVKLYNKNKKEISNKVNYESGLDGTAGKVYFGVTKGNTYYLRVTNVSDREYYSYKYGVRYSVTSATDRSIGTKSSAKTLTRKADSTKTLFRATGNTSTDWYKFKVTSKRKTQIKIDTRYIKSGDLTVTFYKGSNKIDSDKITTQYDGKTYTLTYGSTYGKATSGTYYVKVVKGAKASGMYRIRYVQ